MYFISIFFSSHSTTVLALSVVLFFIIFMVYIFDLSLWPSANSKKQNKGIGLYEIDAFSI